MGKPEATHLRVVLPPFSAVCGTVNSVTYGATEKGRGWGCMSSTIITKCLSIVNKDSLTYYGQHHP